MKYYHICTLPEEKKSLSILRKYVLVSAHNPETKYFFRSVDAVKLEQRRQVDSKQYLIHPLSRCREHWEFFVVIVFVWSLLVIPLNANFCVPVYDYPSKIMCKTEILEIISDVVSIANIFVNFCTGYHNRKAREINLNPAFVAKKYTSSKEFWIDLLSCFPHKFVSYNLDAYVKSKLICKLIDTLFLLKIFRLYRILLFINRIREYMPYYYYYMYSLFKYFSIVSICLHWMVCVRMYFVFSVFGIFHINDTTMGPHIKKWYIRSYWINWSPFLLYCRNVYRTIGHVLCINISTHSNTKFATVNTQEIVKIIVFIIYSSIGYVFGSIIFGLLLQILITLHWPEIKYYSVMNQISEYMSNKRLPQHIRNRVNNFYGYKFRRRYFNERIILDILSETLRHEINMHCCRSLINNVSILRDIPPEIISGVVDNLKHEVYLYNDLIVKAGSTGDCMFFISSGTVSVTTPTGKEICHLQDGAYFGEIALVKTDHKRVANVFAIEICEIYRLDRKSFMRCFQPDSVHYKKLQEIAHERLEMTELLEELHKKYIYERTAQLRADTLRKGV